MKPLTRGRIAAIDGSFGVDDLEDVHGQNTLNGQPSSAINIQERGTLATGQRWVAGIMARRYEDRVESITIGMDGGIEVFHEDDVIEESSRFALVPGEFALAGAEWAFKQLVHAFPVWDYEELAISIKRFYEEVGGFTDISSAGFAARQDRAKKGTVHGQNVTEDQSLGADLREDTHLNELRFTYFPQGFGRQVAAYMAASGYVELYEPTDASTEEFVRYVREYVVPHTEGDMDATTAASGGEGSADA